MDESTFTDLLGNKSFVKILDALLDRVGDRSDFNKKEIQDAAGISESSLHNHWDLLEKNKLLVHTRKLGNIQMYAINTESLLWRKLVELDVEAAMVSPLTVMTSSVTGGYVNDLEDK